MGLSLALDSRHSRSLDSGIGLQFTEALPPRLGS